MSGLHHNCPLKTGHYFFTVFPRNHYDFVKVKFPSPRPAHQRAFCFSAMRFPPILEENDYGDPAMVLERKQEREAADRAKAERKKSPARRALEQLFTTPPHSHEA